MVLQLKKESVKMKFDFKISAWFRPGKNKTRTAAGAVLSCVVPVLVCASSVIARGDVQVAAPFGTVPQAIVAHGSVCPRVLSEPVVPTFPVPRAAVYANRLSPSDVVGHWKLSGTTDGVDFTMKSPGRKAWRFSQSTEYTFRDDGTYSVKNISGKTHSQNSGKWWVEGQLLKLTLQQDTRSYRVLWLDDDTFDLRWPTDADAEAWWKGFHGRGRYKDWKCSVHIAYDAYGCCWKRSEFQKDGEYIVFDTVASPPRYVRCEQEPEQMAQVEPVAVSAMGSRTQTPSVSNPIAREGLALSRIAFSPVNLIGHAYAQIEHYGGVGVVLSPVLAVTAVPGGVMATCCDIVTGLGEMLTFQQCRSVSYPWQSFDYEASERWMGIASETMDETVKVANQAQEVASQIDSLRDDGQAANLQSTAATESPGSQSQSTGGTADAPATGYGSISGPTTIKAGSTATYKLRVGGKVVNADWGQNGTSISVYSAGDHGRAMAGNPPIKKGKFKTGVRATYNGKTYTLSVYILK